MYKGKLNDYLKSHQGYSYKNGLLKNGIDSLCPLFLPLSFSSYFLFLAPSLSNSSDFMRALFLSLFKRTLINTKGTNHYSIQKDGLILSLVSLVAQIRDCAHTRQYSLRHRHIILLKYSLLRFCNIPIMSIN